MVRSVSNFGLYCLAVALVLSLLSPQVLITATLTCALSLCALLYISIRSAFVAVDPPLPKRLEPCLPADLSSSSFSWNDTQLAINHPDAANIIEELVDLVVKSFITPWFQHIDGNNSPAFPNCVKNTILEAVVRLQTPVERIDEGSLIILKILPLFVKHFEMFCMSRDSVVSDLAFEKTSFQNFNLQVAVEYNKINKLHEALSLRTSFLERDISRYMSAKMERVLPLVINEKELSSPLVCIILRDVLATCILSPIVNKLADPDSWNLHIISLSDRILEEQDQVHVIRKFLSKEVQQHEKGQSTDVNSGYTAHVEQDLKPGLPGAQFENYLRYISQLNSFEELQKARFTLMTKLMDINSDDCLTRTSMEYKRRLILSLNLLQTRLRCVDLRDEDVHPRRFDQTLFDADRAVNEFRSFLNTVSLDDILREQRCLVFFEKYLQGRRNKCGLCYVRFWKLVETMKNPLEDGGKNVTVAIKPSEVSQLREFALSFFQGERLENMSLLDAGLVTNITLFMNTSVIDANSAFPLVRRSIILLQNEARKALNENYFQGFKMSKEFLNMLSSSDFVSTELYSKLVIDAQRGNNKKSLKTSPSLNSLRIFSSPEVDEALQNLLTKNTAKRRYSLQQTIKNTLFGENDSGFFDDALFEDDEDFTYGETSSVLGNFDGEDFGSLSSKKEDYERSHFKTFGNSPGASRDLKDDIANLSMAVDQIERQLELLNHLILKAELTNNQSQLKLLQKSKRALIRDLDTKELTKQQLMVQQNENSLYKRTKIAIKSYYMDSQYSDNAEVTFYLINIDHICQGQLVSWQIPRRFSEFFRLNSYLKKKYSGSLKSVFTKDLFPKRVKMSLKYHVSKTLLYKERAVKLERYLNELLRIPQICQDHMLRKFLTDNSMFTLVPEVKGTDIHSEQDQLNNLEDSTSSLSSVREPTPQTHAGPESKIKQFDDLEDELHVNEYEDAFLETSEVDSQYKSVVKSLCDSFISIFSLKKSSKGWLRGRALIAVLQQFLGGTIEKYAIESLKKYRSKACILSLLTACKQKLWPDGQFARKSQSDNQRSDEERKRAKSDSQIMLQCLFAEIFGKVVGLRTAQGAATNLHDMLQNSYLNANLLLEMIDLVLEEVLLNNGQGSCSTV